LGGFFHANESPLLVVALNRVNVTDACRFGIKARGSFCSTLPEEVPALVQILLEVAPPLALGIAGVTFGFLSVELVLLMYQLLYPLSKVLIFHGLPYRLNRVTKQPP
jgi:hypothetical protein